MEYKFKKCESVNVEIDFDKLFDLIKKENPRMPEKRFCDEFVTNSSYYINKMIGYDPYSKFFDCDSVIEVMHYDFGGYLDERGIH